MSIFVVADTEGHAVAVVPTMAAAYEAAGAEAHRVMGDLAASSADDLVWTIETRERTPQWTRLTAFTADRTSMVTYVVTEIEAADGALDATFIQAADRSASTIVGTILATPAAPAVEPVEPSEPGSAPDPAPDPAPEPQAAPQPAEEPTADMPECSAHHADCAGHVEDQQQLELCHYKRLPPMCKSCLKVEVAAKTSPGTPDPERAPEPEDDGSVPVADAES